MAAMGRRLGRGVASLKQRSDVRVGAASVRERLRNRGDVVSIRVDIGVCVGAMGQRFGRGVASLKPRSGVGVGASSRRVECAIASTSRLRGVDVGVCIGADGAALRARHRVAEAAERCRCGGVFDAVRRRNRVYAASTGRRCARR